MRAVEAFVVSRENGLSTPAAWHQSASNGRHGGNSPLAAGPAGGGLCVRGAEDVPDGGGHVELERIAGGPAATILLNNVPLRGSRSTPVPASSFVPPTDKTSRADDASKIRFALIASS